MSEIVVVGGFVVGITVRLPRMPVLGETLVGDLFDLSAGGKGTNLAVAAARQGAKVAMVAMLGSDDFGELAMALYREENIDSRWIVRTQAERTAVGLVYLQPTGENTIGVYEGANKLLSARDVESASSAFKTAKLVAAELETPDDAVRTALTLGRRSGAVTLLNPAPARRLDDDILKAVDVLTPNAVEARILAGLRGDDTTVGLTEIGRSLQRRGPKAVVITMGAAGCLMIAGDQVPVEIPPHSVTPCDTVGAGDAFNGGLAAALVAGEPLPLAVRWANATAALAVCHVGARAGMPRRAQVADLLQAAAPKSITNRG